MARKREITIEARPNRMVPLAEAGEARPNGSLLRGFEVLKAFRSGKGVLGNTEIAATTGLPRATVSRITHGLLEAGYLDYDSLTAKYQLRPRVLTLAFSMLSNLPILPIAHDHMQRLAHASGCTVSLAAPDGSEMIYLDRCSGDKLPYFFTAGSTIETARTAGGRAYLAALSEPENTRAISGLKLLYAEGWKEIEADITVARSDVGSRGFCLVDNTWRQGIRSVAAPLISRDRKTTLAVSLVTPSHAVTVERLVEHLGPSVAHIVRELGKVF